LKEMNMLARQSENNEKLFSELQDKFQALPDFPDRDKKYLERDYQKAGDQFEKLRLKMIDVAEAASLDNLRQRSDICYQLDQLMASSSEDREQQLDAIQGEWVLCDEKLKKAWLQAISRRYETVLQHIHSETKPDYETIDADREMLCIELEILADAETPDSDKARRMEYQLQQLQQGMKTNASVASGDAFLNLEVRWLCADGASQGLALNLHERFNSTLKRAGA
ncbi:MAG: hypothetical protein V3V12_03890, partial [Gammaproteobacteria bacterium]